MMQWHTACCYCTCIYVFFAVFCYHFKLANIYIVNWHLYGEYRWIYKNPHVYSLGCYHCHQQQQHLAMHVLCYIVYRFSYHVHHKYSVRILRANDQEINIYDKNTGYVIFAVVASAAANARRESAWRHVIRNNGCVINRLITPSL